MSTSEPCEAAQVARLDGSARVSGDDQPRAPLSEATLAQLVRQVWARVRRAWRFANARSLPYLAFSAGTAVLAVRAWKPGHNLQNMMTFLGCMIPSEFSWHTLAALVAVVVWYWRRRPERTVALYLAGGLNGVAAAVLGVMSWQSSRARHVFRAAFQRAGIRDAPSLARSATPMRVAITALPSPTLLMNQIEVRRSEVYAHVGYKGTKKLKLDLYWHTGRLKKPGAPVFLYIHGGGWITGHRFFHSLPLLLHMARNGWLVASINYRLAPRVRMPTQLDDCRRAVVWMKRNAARFGGDPNFIVLGGESAGGHLASLVALTARQQVEAGGADTCVQGVVDLYGVHDFTDHRHVFRRRDKGAFMGFIEHVVMRKRLKQHPDMFRDASPVHRLDTAEDIPPFLMVHGDNDTLVPVEDARYFFDRLRQRRRDLRWHAAHRAADREAASGLEPEAPSSDSSRGTVTVPGPGTDTLAPDVYVELPGAHHAFNSLPSHRTWCLGDAVVDWAEHLHTRHQHQAPADAPDEAALERVDLDGIGVGAAPAAQVSSGRGARGTGPTLGTCGGPEALHDERTGSRSASNLALTQDRRRAGPRRARL